MDRRFPLAGASAPAVVFTSMNGCAFCSMILSASLVATSLRGENLDTVPQEEWGARILPIVERMEEHTEGEISSIVIHHTQTPNQGGPFERTRLRGIQSYHVEERGWGDIAYHYLIGPSGRIYEGRDPVFRGDSGTKYDLDGRLLICLLGDFREILPTRAALVTLVDFVVAKASEHDIGEESITTHRRVAATDCPGDALQEWLDEVGLVTIGTLLRKGAPETQERESPSPSAG